VAVLAKPSALLALAGLAAAATLGERAGLRRRLLRGLLPLCVGTGLALVYDAVAASRVHEGLLSFLRAGSTGYYATLAHDARRQALLGDGWLGSGMRLPVVFAIVYALARIGLRHRRAVQVAWPLALAWSWLGPWLAAGEHSTSVGPFSTTSALLLTLAAALILLGALLLPDEDAPARLETTRLLVWAGPPLVAWSLAAGYDDRLLSPAWPALVLLVATVLTAAANGATMGFGAVLAAATLVLVFALALLNASALDGLGDSRWQLLRALGGRAFDPDATRSVVMPDIAPLIGLVSATAGRDGRIFTSDGRLSFYFPGRVNQYYPSGCSTLSGYRAFVLSTDQTSADYLQTYFHVPATPAFWAKCRRPTLTERGELPNYVVFAVRD
jgi:hypothetical protein